LRLHIYSYLLPLDLDSWNLLGLVLSCRTIKDEVYYEMHKLVQRSSERLQTRWPFDKPFNMPFPGLAFNTKQLVIEGPHFSNGESSNLFDEIAPEPSARIDNLKKDGAFDVGARRVLLRIVPSARVKTHAPIAFFRVPCIPLKQPAQREDISILLKLYVALTWNNNVQAQLPKQLIIVEYGRGHPTSANAFPSMVLEMRKESTDRCLKVKQLSSLPIPLDVVNR
jgi:hypothetical protein